MVVVETKDAEQANKMKQVLESKYDHLTITTIGVALGVEDDTATDLDTSSNSDEGDENDDDFKAKVLGGGLAIPGGGSSPLPQRKRMGSFRNQAGGGLSMPVVSHGRRGSMMVQTHIKTPEWKSPDTHAHEVNAIDWSNRGTHYPVHSSH